MSVTAKAEVLVRGAVLSARVIAGGSVRIQQGVLGRDAVVEAGGDLRCRHATSASLAAGGVLRVEESANRLGDYAGIYNQVTEKINVRYDADGTVTLHEAGHIWFNDDLFRERWIGEAFAELYAVQAAAAIGVSGDTFALTEDLLAARIPLNDWAPIGAETEAVEVFAYTASYHLAELILERTDLAGLRAVWRGAADGEMAYQPIHGSDEPRTGVIVSRRPGSPPRRVASWICANGSGWLIYATRKQTNAIAEPTCARFERTSVNGSPTSAI